MLGNNRLRAMALDSAGNASWNEHTIKAVPRAWEVTFQYDGNGSLVSKADHGKTTTYYYDCENRLTKVARNSDGATLFLARRIWKRTRSQSERAFGGGAAAAERACGSGCGQT